MKGILNIFQLVILLLALVSSAFAAPFHGIPYDVTPLRAQDGAELPLFHLKGHPQGPVILLEPGLVETAEMLDGVAAAFYRRGYDVYIGQVRLAGRGDTTSGQGDFNGLEEVLLLDFPAHLREVIRQAGGRDIHLLGHSMGGMEIMAALSDPGLAAEFAPHLKAVTLLAAPHELTRVPWAIRAQAKVMLPIMRGARRLLGRDALGPHTTFFEFTQRMKASRNPVVIRTGQAIENFIIRLGSFVLGRTLVSLNHTTPEAMRRLWFKEVSALPLDLLIDFAEAAGRGEFLARDGHRLIVPERITVPTQVIRAQRDMLVPPRSQASLFERLASKVKRLMDLKGLQHVDPVVNDRPTADFLPQAIDFHDNPRKAAAESPRVIFQPGAPPCQSYLLSEQI